MSCIVRPKITIHYHTIISGQNFFDIQYGINKTGKTNLEKKFNFS